jgi:hypothetical protein
MPKRNQHSQLAKGQRQSGSRHFDSGLIEDFFEAILDPDYDTVQSDRIDEYDSDGEKVVDGGLSFSLVEAGEREDFDISEEISDEDRDLEDEEAVHAIEKGHNVVSQCSVI